MTTVGQVLQGFFDDASLFPPASLPLAEAVAGHYAHRSAWYGPVVGPFVCPASRLGDLAACLAESTTGLAESAARPGEVAPPPMRLSVTFPDGPAELGPALAWLATRPELHLATVEVKLPDDLSPRQVLRLLDEHVPPDVAGYLELPWDDRWPGALDALAVTRFRAKVRTGGVTPQAHPSEWELAEVVRAAVQRGVAFKCTAGLHHAVRHTDGSLEQHGFLNLLLAVDVACHGADVGSVAAVFASRSASALAREAARIAAVGRLAAVRSRLISIGTCSIAEPIADLVRLGLLAEGVHELA